MIRLCIYFYQKTIICRIYYKEYSNDQYYEIIIPSAEIIPESLNIYLLKYNLKIQDIDHITFIEDTFCITSSRVIRAFIKSMQVSFDINVKILNYNEFVINKIFKIYKNKFINQMHSKNFIAGVYYGNKITPFYNCEFNGLDKLKIKPCNDLDQLNEYKAFLISYSFNISKNKQFNNIKNIIYYSESNIFHGNI